MTSAAAGPEAGLTGPGQFFEVAEEEIRGTPTRVWKNAPRSLAAVLEQSRTHGDRIYSAYGDERTTFEQHYRRSAALARELIGRCGVRKGDRVAIAMRNLPEWPTAFWGASAAGAVVVPLNSWGSGEELAFGLQDSGAKLVFADAERSERLREHRRALGDLRVVSVRSETPDGDLPFDELLGDTPGEATLPDVGLEPEDDATLFYTSGTTGRPKGALGTHRNICGNVVSLAFVRVRGALRDGGTLAELQAGGSEQDAYLVSVPFFHVTGCHGVLLGMTAFGGKLVLMHKWDPERALELIERERITTFGGVPTMVWQVLESPSFGRRDVSSVRSIAYGGAPAPPELLRRIEKCFPGCTPSNGYGLTETSSIVTLNTGRDYERKPDSAGLPLPICDLRIAGEAGTEQPRGTLGELWIRGANVVKGYWRRPEATAESFTDGWFHTGDLARVDEEGFLTIVDRLKDVVIRGGENVYCAEVENVLVEHPDVLEAAVIGVPHPLLGEEVGAVVRLRPGARASEDEVRSHVAARLAAFKVPSRVWWHAEPLPTNPAGKVLKRELRERLISAETASERHARAPTPS